MIIVGPNGQLYGSTHDTEGKMMTCRSTTLLKIARHEKYRKVYQNEMYAYFEKWGVDLEIYFWTIEHGDWEASKASLCGFTGGNEIDHIYFEAPDGEVEMVASWIVQLNAHLRLSDRYTTTKSAGTYRFNILYVRRELMSWT